jgi:hypothetical protein
MGRADFAYLRGRIERVSQPSPSAVEGMVLALLLSACGRDEQGPSALEGVKRGLRVDPATTLLGLGVTEGELRVIGGALLRRRPEDPFAPLPDELTSWWCVETEGFCYSTRGECQRMVDDLATLPGHQERSGRCRPDSRVVCYIETTKATRDTRLRCHRTMQQCGESREQALHYMAKDFTVQSECLTLE